MTDRTARRHRFVESFVDAVTVRPFLDDLNRLRRAANLRASSEWLALEAKRDDEEVRAA